MKKREPSEHLVSGYSVLVAQSAHCWLAERPEIGVWINYGEGGEGYLKGKGGDFAFCQHKQRALPTHVLDSLCVVVIAVLRGLGPPVLPTPTNDQCIHIHNTDTHIMHTRNAR